MKKRALIFGITGQDGSLLASMLLKKKYNVYGVSRKIKNKKNLKYLNIDTKIKLFTFNYESKIKVYKLLKKIKFDEIYFFAGQPLPSISNQKRLETLNSNIIPIFNILESIRELKLKTKFYNSCSCEIFGNTMKINNENSEKKPVTVYGLSKLISLETVKFYRQKFKLKAFSGIMFQHESNLRNDNFVIKKIIRSALDLNKKKIKTKIKFGNINISKDWGSAEEYVQIIHKIMINKKKLDDYVICTGQTNSIRSVISYTFKKFHLNWKNFILIDKNLIRKNEIIRSRGSNLKLLKNLKLKPKKNVYRIVDQLIQ